MSEMLKLLRQYDVDRSGSLDMQELTNLIAHYVVESSPGSSVSLSPSESEISWILKTAGKCKENVIHVQELELALQLWRSYVSYVRNRARIEYFFNKYDASHSERLDFDQMKLYLTEMNGCPPKVSVSLSLTIPPEQNLSSDRI